MAEGEGRQIRDVDVARRRSHTISSSGGEGQDQPIRVTASGSANTGTDQAVKIDATKNAEVTTAQANGQMVGDRYRGLLLGAASRTWVTSTSRRSLRMPVTTGASGDRSQRALGPSI